MSNELSLVYEQEQFNALKKAALDVAAQCDKITITDATTLAIAHQQLSLVKEKWNQVEAIRVQLKQPSLDVGRGIDALAKPLLSPLADALAKGKVKILAWEKSQVPKIPPTVGNAFTPVEKPKGMRETWTFEIVDEGAIPRGWMTPNLEMIKQYLSEYKDSLKDGEVKAGIKFFKEKSITIR